MLRFTMKLNFVMSIIFLLSIIAILESKGDQDEDIPHNE